MLPFFSIIVPSYNRASLIIRTIDSILQQSFADFELIVVDDGSTDNTDEVIMQITDSRFSYFKKENGERGATRNFGIEMAKGEYVTFIDSDDIMYVHALQNAFESLKKNEMPQCFAQAFEVVDISSGKQVQPPKFIESASINEIIIKGNFLGCIGVFVKNEVLKQIHFQEDRMFAGTEDWLLWLQLAARYPFYYSNTVCACMIEHENRSVLGFSEEKLLYRTNFLKQKLLDDEVFIQKYGIKAVDKIYAHMLSYTSLHLAISGKNKKAILCFLKAIKCSCKELFTRRTLGIFKTIIYN
jgi:glycosyltransferase involved in cell wall biosynthesis